MAHGTRLSGVVQQADWSTGEKKEPRPASGEGSSPGKPGLQLLGVPATAYQPSDISQTIRTEEPGHLFAARQEPYRQPQQTVARQNHPAGGYIRPLGRGCRNDTSDYSPDLPVRPVTPRGTSNGRNPNPARHRDASEQTKPFSSSWAGHRRRPQGGSAPTPTKGQRVERDERPAQRAAPPPSQASAQQAPVRGRARPGPGSGGAQAPAAGETPHVPGGVSGRGVRPRDLRGSAAG